jgi:hypothetical protein
MRRLWFLLFLILFLIGCATSIPKTLGPQFYMAISMAEPQKIYPSYDERGYIKFEDETIKIKFTIREREIGFYLTNKTSEPMTLLWDSSVYIDILSVSHRVMRKSVRYAEKNSFQPPTLIDPENSIDDFIVPRNNIVPVTGGGWVTMPLFPSYGKGKDEELYKGKQFGVLLALDIGNETRDYLFQFKIDDVYAPKYFGLPKEGGVFLGIARHAVNDGILVLGVKADSSASKANIEKGDKILEINGKVVNSMKTFSQALETLRVGEKYDILILRNGQLKTISIVAEGYKR